MKTYRTIAGWLMLLALSTLNLQLSTCFAQGTAFTYQGRLASGGNAAQGIFDLRFSIYDSASGGSVYGVLTNAATPVTNGLFTVTLDFGSGVFDGNARWLDIGVRTNGGGAFTTLNPRQPVTPTPYAIQAATATSAATAASVPASGIGPGTANINISGYAITAVSAASAGSAAVAATAVNFTGPLAGDVTGTQGATTVERVRGIQVSTNVPSANQHLRFDGTRWVPAAVALGTDVSGTLADARLSTNVALLNANQTFTGSNMFSGVVTATNPANVFNGTFAGGGADLTGLNASSLSGGTLPEARLSTNVALLNGSANFSGTVSATTFAGNGVGVTNVNLQTINSQGAINWTPSVWGCFALASSPGAGSHPYSVAAADVNGDGKTDLISANFYDSTLSVLTNNGNGAFELASSPGVGTAPTSVAAQDVNGDGWIDLISVNSKAASLTVLTNNGSGGFVVAAWLPVGNTPLSIVAADVNSDGQPDLICANSGANTLTVLTNNGSGGFALASSPGVGSYPYSVRAADVNGDGKVDLISANWGANNLTVLTNNGSGGFYLSSSPGVGTGPYSVAAADVNGDGKVDLISANWVANTLTVLTNNGSGGFVTASSPGVGSSPDSVAAADVNGDGKVDLISANYGGSTLTVLTNNGSGGFVTASSPGVGSFPISVTAADVNGDGGMDLISANSGDNTLSVLFNTPIAYQAGFTGNGSGLTGLNTTNLIGTIADARLSANVALLNSNQVFTGAVQFTNVANNFVGTFTGNGAGLTNLNAGNLAGGTIADARLSTNVALLNANQTFTGSNTFSGVVTATNPASTFAGNGAGLTNLNASMLASGTLPSGRLSGTYSSAVTLNNVNASGSFSGSGAGLMSLNANNLASGTVPDGRLSSTYLSQVTFNNAGNNFIGNGSGLTSLNANNLSGGFVPNACLSGTYSSQVTFNNAVNNFTGNGSGLTSLNASSLSGGFVPDGRLSGTYSSAVTFNNAGGNSFSGNGSGLTSLNANNLSSGTVPDARLSANVALLNGSPGFSTPVTMSNFLSTARMTITVTGNGMMITPTNSYVLLNSTGAYTLGGISSGTRIGDVLILQGGSDLNTVQINNNTNTKLTAANHVLGANDMLMLIWTGTAWTELSFANN